MSEYIRKRASSQEAMSGIGNQGHGGYRAGRGIESATGRDFDRRRRSRRPYPQNRAQGSLGGTGQALRLNASQTRDPLASTKTGVGDCDQEDRRPGLLEQAG